MQLSQSKSGNPKEPTREGRAVIVGRVEDLPPGGAATVELADGKQLALYNVGGEFYATENFCPHKGAPLANGTLCNHIIECNWHNWRFDVRTGRCLTNNVAIETYQVLIEDGQIKIII